MGFFVNANERLRITSTGRVKIGTGAVGLTNSMTAQGGLQVSTNGASGAPTVCFGADGTAANTQTITDNTIKDFRMGFPNYDIQEEPLALISGFVGDGSALTGISAGFSADADGNLMASNTCSGCDLDGSSGCYNVLLGACAGRSVTSGTNNVFLGRMYSTEIVSMLIVNDNI